MPKETFLRLPKEKQERIVDAAVDEFAAVPYSESSINRIIKAAGIPRGSFYQYFDGKEDLYLYLMGRIAEEKMEVYEKYDRPEGGFFESLDTYFPAMAEWVTHRPKYGKIAAQMSRDGSEFIREIIKKMDTSMESVRELLRRDQRAGLIRKDVDLDLVLDLYLSAVSGMMREDYQEENYAGLMNKARELIKILAYGICAGEEPNE